MTVTSAPNRLHTEPSSRPMTPAPITAMVFGTLGSSRAPVDETICFSSISTPGSGVTSDPVAMMIFPARIVSALPSAPVTVTRPAAGMEPAPRSRVILFFFIR